MDRLTMINSREKVHNEKIAKDFKLYIRLI